MDSKGSSSRPALRMPLAGGLPHSRKQLLAAAFVAVILVLTFVNTYLTAYILFTLKLTKVRRSPRARSK